MREKRPMPGWAVLLVNLLIFLVAIASGTLWGLIVNIQHPAIQAVEPLPYATVLPTFTPKPVGVSGPLPGRLNYRYATNDTSASVIAYYKGLMLDTYKFMSVQQEEPKPGQTVLRFTRETDLRYIYQPEWHNYRAGRDREVVLITVEEQPSGTTTVEVRVLDQPFQ